MAAVAPQDQELKKNNPQLRTITNDELSKHCSDVDLWVSIQGKIYDVSSWASSHPGGDLALKTFAGQADATDAFLAFHPPRAYAFLPKFLIGSLADYSPSPVTADHERVIEELNKAGLLEIPLGGYCKIFLAIFLMFIASVGGVVFSSSPLIHWISAMLMGWVWIQAGWIGHDTGHAGMTGDRNTDSWIGLLVGNTLSGIGFAWWKKNHNAHHFSCNSLDYDPDLQYIPIFAVSSRFFNNLYSHFYNRDMHFDGLARFLVSYQHWTFYLVMAVARINLYAQSFMVAIWGKKIRNRGLEICTLLFFWIWFLCLLSHLPTTSERFAFLLISLATTGIQHVQFCLNHFSSPVYQGRPQGSEWFIAQASGTLNLSCSKQWDWFHGGLHYQVEHHFFPRIPRLNLRKASEQVVKPMFIDKHNLPYTSVSFWQANVMIIRTLRKAAVEARDMNRPLSKKNMNMLWEAVNSHG